jgi:hypothetical protein
MMGQIYKYVTEIGCVTMLYVRNFIKIGSGIQKMIGEGKYTRHTGNMEIV